MTNTYTKHFNNRNTAQTEKIPGTKQVPNSAGGYYDPPPTVRRPPRPFRRGCRACLRCRGTRSRRACR